MSNEELTQQEIADEAPSRGYITLGINTGEDNVRYCYALACSILNCDPNASITLVVDKGQSGTVPSYYEHVFDYMIELPYGNSAHKDGFHGMNLWQVFHCTPYKETIYVDYDTLFVNVDTTNLWDIMSVNKAISFPKNALSYRNFHVPPDFRHTFELQYQLPRLYYNMIYFHKDSQEAMQWFKMADPIFQHWRDVYTNTFTDRKPEDFEKNILGNITTHFMDMHDEVGIYLNNHYDLHSLSHGAFPSLEEVPRNWTDMLNYWVTDNQKIQIENSIISSGIIHYSDETFLTDEVIDVFRSKLITRLQER
tara:strand:+ start:19283 stop:20206 length:924 start_codon:yes stop_codon:yes gene_type:complete